MMKKKQYPLVYLATLLLFVSILFLYPRLGLTPMNVHSEAPLIKTEPIEIEVPLHEKFGQNLIVGIPSTVLDEESREILEQLKPAGIVLYQRNFSSQDQLKTLIADLQKLAQETTASQYFIMLDEEPEGANRLGLLKNIFTLGNPQWTSIEKDIQTLKQLGINVLLAPLADFPFVPNAFISRRIPFKDPESLKAFNRTFIRLLQENGIHATLKHFPGLGLFTDDPHYTYIRTDSPPELLHRSMALFQDGIDHGAHFIMSCHAQYDSFDDSNPSTFSHQIITTMLQQELDFQGIVVSDDLSDMPLAIENLDLTDAGIRTIKAGHHLIMFSHHLPYTRSIVDSILQKASQDQVLLDRIEENYQKIVAFKQQQAQP
jgi:beta-N-acetylhexosaminidase